MCTWSEMESLASVPQPALPIEFKVISAPGLDLDYGILYQPDDAYKIFDRLMKEVIFMDDMSLKICGKWRKIPRKQAIYGSLGTRYRFSGNTFMSSPWCPTLKRLKDIVETTTGLDFNLAVVNLYKDGSDSIASHRDNESDLIPGASIVSLTFGAVRPFVFTRKGHKPIRINLENGSILILRPPTNDHWNHCLPKRKGVTEPRINVTFRKVFVHKLNGYSPPDVNYYQLYDDQLRISGVTLPSVNEQPPPAAVDLLPSIKEENTSPPLPDYEEDDVVCKKRKYDFVNEFDHQYFTQPICCDNVKTESSLSYDRISFSPETCVFYSESPF